MLRIAQITDLHLNEEGTEPLGLDNRARFLSVLNAARATQPDLYFLTGDFSMDKPDRAAIEWLREQLRDLGAPVHILSGNHDNTPMLREVFNYPNSTDDTLDYTFSLHDLDVIAMDSGAGEMRPNQLAWLQQQLIRASRPVLFIHHPPLPVGSRFMDRKHSLRNHQPLLDLLTSMEQPIPIFCGHCHAALCTKYRNLTINVAPPTSFFIDPLSEEFRQLDLPPAYQLIEYEDERYSVMPQYVM